MAGRMLCLVALLVALLATNASAVVVTTTAELETAVANGDTTIQLERAVYTITSTLLFNSGGSVALAPFPTGATVKLTTAMATGEPMIKVRGGSSVSITGIGLSIAISGYASSLMILEKEVGDTGDAVLTLESCPVGILSGSFHESDGRWFELASDGTVLNINGAGSVITGESGVDTQIAIGTVGSTISFTDGASITGVELSDGRPIIETAGTLSMNDVNVDAMLGAGFYVGDPASTTTATLSLTDVSFSNCESMDLSAVVSPDSHALLRVAQPVDVTIDGLTITGLTGLDDWLASGLDFVESVATMAEAVYGSTATITDLTFTSSTNIASAITSAADSFYPGSTVNLSVVRVSEVVCALEDGAPLIQVGGETVEVSGVNITDTTEFLTALEVHFSSNAPEPSITISDITTVSETTVLATGMSINKAFVWVDVGAVGSADASLVAGSTISVSGVNARDLACVASLGSTCVGVLLTADHGSSVAPAVNVSDVLVQRQPTTRENLGLMRVEHIDSSFTVDDCVVIGGTSFLETSGDGTITLSDSSAVRVSDVIQFQYIKITSPGVGTVTTATDHSLNLRGPDDREWDDSEHDLMFDPGVSSATIKVSVNWCSVIPSDTQTNFCVTGEPEGSAAVDDPVCDVTFLDCLGCRVQTYMGISDARMPDWPVLECDSCPLGTLKLDDGDSDDLCVYTGCSPGLTKDEDSGDCDVCDVPGYRWVGTSCEACDEGKLDPVDGICYTDFVVVEPDSSSPRIEYYLTNSGLFDHVFLNPGTHTADNILVTTVGTEAVPVTVHVAVDGSAAYAGFISVDSGHVAFFGVAFQPMGTSATDQLIRVASGAFLTLNGCLFNAGKVTSAPERSWWTNPGEPFSNPGHRGLKVNNGGSLDLTDCTFEYFEITGEEGVALSSDNSLAISVDGLTVSGGFGDSAVYVLNSQSAVVLDNLNFIEGWYGAGALVSGTADCSIDGLSASSVGTSDDFSDVPGPLLTISGVTGTTRVHNVDVSIVTAEAVVRVSSPAFTASSPDLGTEVFLSSLKSTSFTGSSSVFEVISAANVEVSTVTIATASLSATVAPATGLHGLYVSGRSVSVSDVEASNVSGITGAVVSLENGAPFPIGSLSQAFGVSGVDLLQCVAAGGSGVEVDVSGTGSTATIALTLSGVENDDFACSTSDCKGLSLVAGGGTTTASITDSFNHHGDAGEAAGVDDTATVTGLHLEGWSSTVEVEDFTAILGSKALEVVDSSDVQIGSLQVVVVGTDLEGWAVTASGSSVVTMMGEATSRRSGSDSSRRDTSDYGVVLRGMTDVGATEAAFSSDSSQVTVSLVECEAESVTTAVECTTTGSSASCTASREDRCDGCTAGTYLELVGSRLQCSYCGSGLYSGEASDNVDSCITCPSLTSPSTDHSYCICDSAVLYLKTTTGTCVLCGDSQYIPAGGDECECIVGLHFGPSGSCQGCVSNSSWLGADDGLCTCDDGYTRYDGDCLLDADAAAQKAADEAAAAAAAAAAESSTSSGDIILLVIVGVAVVLACGLAGFCVWKSKKSKKKDKTLSQGELRAKLLAAHRAAGTPRDVIHSKMMAMGMNTQEANDAVYGKKGSEAPTSGGMAAPPPSFGARGVAEPPRAGGRKRRKKKKKAHHQGSDRLRLSTGPGASMFAGMGVAKASGMSESPRVSGLSGSMVRPTANTAAASSPRASSHMPSSVGTFSDPPQRAAGISAPRVKTKISAPPGGGARKVVAPPGAVGGGGGRKIKAPRPIAPPKF